MNGSLENLSQIINFLIDIRIRLAGSLHVDLNDHHRKRRFTAANSFGKKQINELLEFSSCHLI